jgi:hypothetical protein
MPTIESAWAGDVQFYELLFGTWTAYILLVLWWQKVLAEPLDEWRYVMIAFLGAAAFWVNHYFQRAPFWLSMINWYALGFFVAYWLIAIRGRQRAVLWKFGALLSALLFTVAFIGFEQLARYGVNRWGMHEFCWMFLSLFGFSAVIWWRGHTSVQPRPKSVSPYPQTSWRGLGGNA